MEGDGTTESWSTVWLRLRPICTMLCCRIYSWQIYNWCTLCCDAALRATVLQPASSWFSPFYSLAVTRDAVNTFYSRGKWKIQYSQSICNLHTHVKFNFLRLPKKRLSPDIQASEMATGLISALYGPTTTLLLSQSRVLVSATADDTTTEEQLWLIQRLKSQSLQLLSQPRLQNKCFCFKHFFEHMIHSRK